MIGVDWNDYPNIRDWLDRIKLLPGWKMPEALMPSGGEDAGPVPGASTPVEVSR